MENCIASYYKLFIIIKSTTIIYPFFPYNERSMFHEKTIGPFDWNAYNIDICMYYVYVYICRWNKIIAIWFHCSMNAACQRHRNGKVVSGKGIEFLFNAFGFSFLISTSWNECIQFHTAYTYTLYINIRFTIIKMYDV